MNEYLELLRTWCDRMLDCQITELPSPAFRGGILCPACTLIHGRIGDLVYPLLTLYDKTGDGKYLRGALLVVEWSENNVRMDDGGYVNDRGNPWRGTAAFSAMAVGQALLHHGGCLKKKDRDHLFSVFRRLLEFSYRFFENDGFRPVVNYRAGEAALMALGWKLTGEERYFETAKKWAEELRSWFGSDGILAGEGDGGAHTPSTRGSSFVDMGYDMEESLPLLAQYAVLTGDEDYRRFIADRFRDHLEFMLPDGGVDNSFGTRNNKWTYHGSRTSDGCQEGLCLLADLDPVFAEAAQRNLELYRRCTADGLLHGGLQYIEHDERPCVHHAFTHAKALAAMVDSGFECRERVALPRDREYGIRYFPTAGTYLASVGGFRATVSVTDAVNYDGAATTGGSMTLLWHTKTGPLLAASPCRFVATEPRNMQMPSHEFGPIPCITMRIVRGRAESVNCRNAVSEISGDTVDCRGKLCTTAFGEDAAYSLRYTFQRDSVTVEAFCEQDARLVIPAICGQNEQAAPEDGKVVLHRAGADVTFANEKLVLPQGTDARHFCLVGGFDTLPIEIPLEGGRPQTLVISVAEA